LSTNPPASHKVPGQEPELSEGTNISIIPFLGVEPDFGVPTPGVPGREAFEFEVQVKICETRYLLVQTLDGVSRLRLVASLHNQRALHQIDTICKLRIGWRRVRQGRSVATGTEVVGCAGDRTERDAPTLLWRKYG
jgi:hypothetical protein